MTDHFVNFVLEKVKEFVQKEPRLPDIDIAVTLCWL